MTPRPILRALPEEVWGRIAAPLATGFAGGVDDGLASPSDSRELAELVRARLDAVVPGGWELAFEPLAGTETGRAIVKARLSIHGIAREDVAGAPTVEEACDRALVRAARRFGLGTTSRPALSVHDTGAARAEPADDEEVAVPAAAATALAPARQAKPTDSSLRSTPTARPTVVPPAAEGKLTVSADDDFPSCPKCGDVMWDDRTTKRAGDGPDFRCPRKGCGGVLWISDRTAERAGAAEIAAPETRLDEEDFPF